LLKYKDMNKQQAKAELKKIRKQKTVSVKKLNRILNVLDYEALEKGYINQAGKLKSMKNKDREIRRLTRVLYRRDKKIAKLEGVHEKT